tara:strand:+ start:145 stop:1212 length:1068 start_codon:yes stop_codon:yes gene_type:complete
MFIKIKAFIKNLLFSFITIFFIFEFTLFFFPVREPANTIPQTESSILKLKPNYEYTYSTGPFFQINAKKNTNNYGYNSNYDYEKNKGDILVIGDSFVDAAEVNNFETFHHKLKEKINKNVYQLSHSSSNLAQYYKFAEFGVSEFKPNIIIYNIVANDYFNAQPGKYNFNLDDEKIFLKKDGYPEKKLIHKILLKSNLVRYLYYNVRPHHQINYLLNMRNKNFEGNIPCEYTNKELNENKKTFDLFLNYNKTFLDKGIKIIVMFDPIRSKIYKRNLNNCGLNDGETGLATKIREYSVNKVKEDGVYTLDLETYFANAYARNNKKFEFKNDLHWNKYTHNLVSEILIEFMKVEKILE